MLAYVCLCVGVSLSYFVVLYCCACVVGLSTHCWSVVFVRLCLSLFLL